MTQDERWLAKAMNAGVLKPERLEDARGQVSDICLN